MPHDHGGGRFVFAFGAGRVCLLPCDPRTKHELEAAPSRCYLLSSDGRLMRVQGHRKQDLSIDPGKKNLSELGVSQAGKPVRARFFRPVYWTLIDLAIRGPLQSIP